jgi:serine/threonine protein kinase
MDILQNRYQVEQQLGKKAGRQTVLARDLETQELVVVKLLTFGADFEWDDLKLFEREAETLRSLNHPAIPKYLDYFELETATTKGFALVQSYIEAKSLEQHLKAGRSFTETEVKQLAESLLDILVYLHSQQPAVIHRDIKPSNILLGDRTGNHVGQVYLVDFGSVQTLVAQEGGTITVVGTYGYMPPEQYGGRATAASDLYSLGATLVYLTTGKHPADLPQRNLQLQFKAFATLSEAFLDWLEWLTEPSLENRLESAEMALEVLRQEQPRSQRSPSIKLIPHWDRKSRRIASRNDLKLTQQSLEEIQEGKSELALTLVPAHRSTKLQRIKRKLAPALTKERVLWNAIWRFSTVGASVSAVLFATYAKFSSSYSSDWRIVALSMVLAAITGGSLGLGLGFLNGLLSGLLTLRSMLQNSRLHRWRVGLLVSLFSAGLVYGFLLLSSINWIPFPLFVVILAGSMGLTTQSFMRWYLQETRFKPLAKLKSKVRVIAAKSRSLPR